MMMMDDHIYSIYIIIINVYYFAVYIIIMCFIINYIRFNMNYIS